LSHDHNKAAFTLRPDPNWHSAAQDLVTGLCSISDPEQQIELLETLCTNLGDKLYPAFLQILHVINQHADLTARKVVARTLVSCLQTGRLPSGKLSAWGSSTITGDNAFGQSRRLGPVEFVCAWYAQPSTELPISQLQFSTILNSLLLLVASEESAKTLYCHKLMADAEDPLEGSLSSQTRAGLVKLTQHWQHNSNNNSPAIEAFLSALQQESLLNQINERPFT